MKIYYYKTAPRKIEKVHTGLQSDGSYVMAADIKGNECTPIQVRVLNPDSMFPQLAAIDMQTGKEYVMRMDVFAEASMALGTRVLASSAEAPER